MRVLSGAEAWPRGRVRGNRTALPLSSGKQQARVTISLPPKCPRPCAALCPLLVSSRSYVSRYHVKDSSRHVILGTQQFKPNEFASQINLSVENAWGILRCVIDICMKLEEGKYLILKDPNKQVIRVYSLPDGTFSSDEDDEDEEEEEEEEEGVWWAPGVQRVYGLEGSKDQDPRHKGPG